MAPTHAVQECRQAVRSFLARRCPCQKNQEHEGVINGTRESCRHRSYPSSHRIKLSEQLQPVRLSKAATAEAIGSLVGQPLPKGLADGCTCAGPRKRVCTALLRKFTSSCAYADLTSSLNSPSGSRLEYDLPIPRAKAMSTDGGVDLCGAAWVDRTQGCAAVPRSAPSEAARGASLATRSCRRKCGTVPASSKLALPCPAWSQCTDAPSLHSPGVVHAGCQAGRAKSEAAWQHREGSRGPLAAPGGSGGSAP